MFAVLLYHGIEDGRPSPRTMDDIDREYVLDRKRFEAHMAYLGTKPAGAVPVVISFDDGDESCFTTAAPVLERHGLRGQFFVVTDWIGQPGFMTAGQLRELIDRGHGVHSHSRSHRRMSSLSVSQIDEELQGSKAELEGILSRPVTQFSFPGGAYDARVIDAARRAGYNTVFNSVEGYNADEHGFLRRRFTTRAYSDMSMLREICEHPTRTKARLALKRLVLDSARTVLGARYDRVRARLISRRRGEGERTSRR